jgi:outer membrane protein insertion porin family
MTGGSDDALGGDRFVRTSLEASFPTFMPKDLGFKGHVFTDAATLSHSGEKAQTGEDYRDNSNIRLSAGFGISWASPFGPVRLDFAIPVIKEDYDNTESIHFSFGTRF